MKIRQQNLGVVGLAIDLKYATFDSILRHAYEPVHFRGRVPCARDVIMHVEPNQNMGVD